MKRIAMALASAAFSFTLLFKCGEIVKPIKASANEATLTPAQTRALFGDRLDGEYHPTKTGALTACTFEYYADGIITAESSDATFPYTTLQKNVIIYRSPANFSFYNDGYNTFNIRLSPSVSLTNLHFFRMSMGASTASLDPSIPSGSSTLAKQTVTLSTDFYNGTMSSHDYQSLKIQNGTAYKEATVSIDVLDGSNSLGTPNTSYFTINPIVLDATNSSSSFSVVFFERYFANYGYKRNLNFDKPVNIANTTGFDDFYYLYIECPLLSDDYVDNNASSGGGSDSGSDSPDYSGDLQDILDKLDQIILQNQIFNGQLNDIDMHIQYGNSKLDSANDKLNQNNSKLDTVNSNLNKINSTIENLNVPDLVSQSARDSSHIADNTSRMAAEISDAMQDHQYIDSIARSAEMSLPNLDNQHALDSSFNDVWYYTDEDGLKWSNPLLFAMPIVTLTIGVLSYIIFGKKG